MSIGDLKDDQIKNECNNNDQFSLKSVSINF